MLNILIIVFEFVVALLAFSQIAIIFLDTKDFNESKTIKEETIEEWEEEISDISFETGSVNYFAKCDNGEWILEKLSRDCTEVKKVPGLEKSKLKTIKVVTIYEDGHQKEEYIYEILLPL